MELNKGNIRKIMLLITFTVLLFIGIENIDVVARSVQYVFGLIFPFFLGAVLAFAFNVPMRFIEKWLGRIKWGKKKRGNIRMVGFLLTLIIIVGILFVLSFLVVPQVSKTIQQLIDVNQDYNLKTRKWILGVEKRFPLLEQIIGNPIDINWKKIFDGILGFFDGSMGTMVGSTFGFLSQVVSGVVSFFIAIVFCCYILFQKERLGVQSKKILFAFLKEERADRFLRFCRLTDDTFSKFLVGQCTEAIILGTMFVVSMLILRLPYAMLIGVLIAVLALIPIIGAFIGCFIGAFLILMDSPTKALVFVILFLVLQQIEGNLIYPHVVGNSVGLPSIWVLFAVTIGGKLLGIAGMIIGIPLVSVIYVLFAEYVNGCLAKKKVSYVKYRTPPQKKK